MAADSPARQRAGCPLHGGARPQPLHLLQVTGQEGEGLPTPGVGELGGLQPWGCALTALHTPPPTSFRMRQVNIVGTSPASQPSRKIQTLQAPPDMAPANVTLRTASETSLWLRWMVRPPEGSGGGVSPGSPTGPIRGTSTELPTAPSPLINLAPGRVPDNPPQRSKQMPHVERRS